MRLTLRGKILCDAVDRVCYVGTHGVLKKCDYAGRVVITAHPTHITFTSTNGHLTARLDVTISDDPQMCVATTGTVNVSANQLLRVARYVGLSSGGDHLVELFMDTGSLILEDGVSGARGWIDCKALPPLAQWPVVGGPALSIPGQLFQGVVVPLRDTGRGKVTR